MSTLNRRNAVKLVTLGTLGGVSSLPSGVVAQEGGWREKFDKAVQAIPEFPFDEPGDRAPDPTQPNRRQLTIRTEELTAFQPNADVMWVGNLIQGKSIKSGILLPMSVAPENRAPVELTTSLLGSAPASAQVERPSHANVTKAINGLIEGYLKTGGVQASRATFNQTRMETLDQSALNLGVSAESMSWGMKASFEAQKKKASSTVLIRFVQAYFTVSCDLPITPSSVLLNETALATIAGQYGNGNPPVYISTQTWGRELWLCVSSNESIHKLEASIEASFKSLVGSGKIEAGQRETKTFLESSISGYAIGGSFGDAKQILTGDPAEPRALALSKYVAAGQTMTKDSPPALISYQLKYLGSRELARLSFDTKYTLPSPRKAKKFQVTYQTVDSDKDGSRQGSGGAQVIFTMQLDKKELGSVDIGDERFVNWPDNTNPKTFTLMLDEPIAEVDIAKCEVQVRQEPVKLGGNPSWRFRFKVQAFFDNDKKPTTVLDFPDPIGMRQPNGTPYMNRTSVPEEIKCFDFDGAYQSTPWIPLLRP